MEQALSLPEIRRHICQFLRPRDYKACALVSRAWAESVTPWIWYSVTPPMLDSPEKCTILHKYKAFVRTLSIDGFKTRVDFYGWFENLQVLYFGYFDHTVKFQEFSGDLVHRSQSSLRWIYVNCSGDKKSVILKAALGCSMLKHLGCSFVTIRDRGLMESFIRTCSRLTSLHLKTFQFVEGTHLMFEGQAFANLEQVKLEGIKGSYLELLRACPNLKALNLFRVQNYTVETFLEVVRTHCRDLCVLLCGNCGFDSTDEFKMLALALPPMKYLQGTNIIGGDVLVSSIYSRHFETLQAIDILNFDQGSSNDVQTILSSCPNLRSFVGEVIDAEDIQSGSPWVCQGLRHLQVDIAVYFGESHLNSIVCGQLSQLKELRILSLYRDGSFSQSRSLSLRLGEGLELLASLKKLEHFGVGSLQPKWGAEWRTEDLEWMALEWPSLEAIYGEYSMKEEMYTRLCEHLGVSRVRKGAPAFDYTDIMDSIAL